MNWVGIIVQYYFNFFISVNSCEIFGFVCFICASQEAKWFVPKKEAEKNKKMLEKCRSSLTCSYSPYNVSLVNKMFAKIQLECDKVVAVAAFSFPTFVKVGKFMDKQ